LRFLDHTQSDTHTLTQNMRARYNSSVLVIDSSQ